MRLMFLAECVQQIAPTTCSASQSVDRFHCNQKMWKHAGLRQQCASNTMTKRPIEPKLQYVQNLFISPDRSWKLSEKDTLLAYTVSFIVKK